MKIRFLMGLATIVVCAYAQNNGVPRVDGHPDLTGIWQAFGTANWDLEDHGPEAGPFYQLGAIGAIPPGRGVVEGGTIPTSRQPWNSARRIAPIVGKTIPK